MYIVYNLSKEETPDKFQIYDKNWNILYKSPNTVAWVENIEDIGHFVLGVDYEIIKDINTMPIKIQRILMGLI
jgi:hypothetical protein